MISYFEDKKNVERCIKIINSWIGTPYHHLKSIKGGGVDCSLLIGYIMKELGILTEVKFNWFPSDWFIHTKYQKMVFGFFDNWKDCMVENYQCSVYNFRFIDELIFGDILLFKLQKNSSILNHSGLYIGNKQVVHSINERSVGIIPLGTFLKNRLDSFYRVEVI